MGVFYEARVDKGRGDCDNVRKLISRTKQNMGTLTKVNEIFQADSETLRDGYVKACMIVVETYTANKLIRAGLASGWRFLVTDNGFVELWAPAVGQPVKYIFQNATLARSIAARGSGLITRGD